ncbi:hypothetical protein GSM42_10455 [Shimazuella sp. KC615]|uniref:Uncharacterized protein n=1 Tax=Shimazuella alba TaxID=2690964 RepID=A0A6I4VR53_9BACL|nr:hypothetical protein [Shimazuella alba]
MVGAIFVSLFVLVMLMLTAVICISNICKIGKKRKGKYKNRQSCSTSYGNSCSSSSCSSSSCSSSSCSSSSCSSSSCSSSSSSGSSCGSSS